MDVLAIIKRIEMRLSEIGMSKSDFYKKSGISSASFSQWRKGIYEPSEKKLIDAARCLEISLEYLVDGISGEGVTSLANGIRIFYSSYPDRIKKLMEDIVLEECRVVYEVPGCVITVDNDSIATEEDIAKIINSHRLNAPEDKKELLVNDDQELTEYLEALKTRPEMRMLFQLSKDATKEDVEAAVRIIEALRNK